MEHKKIDITYKETEGDTSHYREVKSEVERILSEKGSYIESRQLSNPNSEAALYTLPKGTAIFSHGLLGPQSLWSLRIRLASIEGDFDGLDEQLLAVDEKMTLVEE